MVTQVRIKPKSYKTQVCVKFENNLIHPELSLVLPVLACTKRVEVCLAFLSARNRVPVSYLPLVAFCSGVIPIRDPSCTLFARANFLGLIFSHNGKIQWGAQFQQKV